MKRIKCDLTIITEIGANVYNNVLIEIVKKLSEQYHYYTNVKEPILRKLYEKN